MTTVFKEFEDEAYPHKFIGQLKVATIAGGIPTDPRVAEGWLRSKLGDKDDQIRDLVATTMIERGVSAEEAAKLVDEFKHLNGFKRDKNGLYIEGRQLKAAIKEAASVAMAADKLASRGWGRTNKGLLSYAAEHIFVVEDRLYLGVEEATGVNQRFVHTFRGSGIQYEEFVNDAVIDFTVISDHDFTDREWAMLWLSGQQQGIGASRSQGFGKYEVTRWDRVGVRRTKSRVKE
jgi:hypothetical protein